MEKNQGLELLALKKFTYTEELYLLVDFLNKNLKDKRLVFGLSLEEDGSALISIYNS